MGTNRNKPESRIGFPWPVAHIMALAPLDVWARILAGSPGVRPRYWPRLGFILFTSYIGTIFTIYERLILAIVKHLKFKGTPAIDHSPGTIIILGYYRTGTTHLHNLLSCDDRFVTPKWYQALAGQGFWLGWSMLRFMLVPFLNTTRPQDSVGFGPTWPAEDDFALCSAGACSSIPGRLIFPSQWDTWKRWHTLEALSDQERRRWKTLMAMLIWKLTRGKNKARIVLLKTPSHTARIAQLDQLFGGQVKFIHLVRDPQAVIDSNVRLHDSLKSHLLEAPPPPQTTRDRIVEEYTHTESKCSQELDAIDPSRWTRIRYQDLRADPIATLSSMYTSLGMNYDDTTKTAHRWYLAQLGDYHSSKSDIELGAVTQAEQIASQEMIDRYQLNAPTIPANPIEPHEPTPCRFWKGLGAGLVLMIICAGVWLGTVYSVHAMWPSMHLRLIPAIWICGALIGLGIHKAAGNGSRTLGIFAAVMTLAVVLGTAFPVAVINYNFASTPGYSTQDWIYHNSKYAYEGLRSIASMILVLLAVVTAYRHASANGVLPPHHATKHARANTLKA